MPGLQLYQTEPDELELVGAALEAGCWLVPASHYETTEFDKLFTIEAYMQARIRERKFFILGSEFTLEKLSMESFSKEGKTLFYIVTSSGGPFLEFLGGGLFVDDATGEKRIRPGFLEFARDYWAADLSRKRPSPPELEEMYKWLARAVKTKSTRIKPGKGVFWLGNDAKTQLENGARLVGYESWSLSTQAPLEAA